ncbi:MAG TPA: hypothetical protein VM677_12840 [Actinokineospora sp.]|jgi:hypothetical protein|nr:hypothetical protein [Actinokineospora sp.]
MASTRQKKKTVSFYEVRDENGTRLGEALDWDSILDDLARQSAKSCRHRIFGTEHWGRVYHWNDLPNFILVRARDEGVSAFDIDNEQFIDHESEAGSPYVELSITKFLPGTNRFGFVLGSNASSRAGSMEAWINEHKMFKERISIVPLVSQRVLEKIDKASEAKLLKVRLDRDHVAAVGPSNGLYSVFQNLKNKHGGVDAELILRVKGRINNDYREERQGLLETAKSVANTRFSKAFVELINYDANGKPHVDKVDFMNDLLARKMDVSVTDDEGNPVRIPSAITAIERAAERLREEFDALD